MSGTALKISGDGGGTQSLRFPTLPGRQPPNGVDVDTQSEDYKAGYAAAASDLAGQVGDLHKSHETFSNAIADMLADVDARYRQDYLALVKRVFTAVAPMLARHASLIEILKLVEEHSTRGQGGLALHVHPELVAYLSEDQQRTLQENPSINLKTDPSCAPTSIDVRWAKGGLAHDPDALIAEIMNILGPEDPADEE